LEDLFLLGSLKQKNISIDLKLMELNSIGLVHLADTNEDDPGVEIKNRMKDVELYDYEWEVENS